MDARRTLREIRILRTVKHENILDLLNVIYDESVKDFEFGDIYLVTSYMDIDLFRIIRSGQDLTDEHIKFIVYQILKSLKYLHSVQIVHRDLKPSNILANEKCEIKLCDFGLSRQIEETDEREQKKMQNEQLTEYVVTRYYRAPEIMLSSHDYNKAVDMWSLGCTMAELLTRTILFKNDSYVKLIKSIFERLGVPEEDELKFITNQNAKNFVNSLPKTPQK